jgi:hypothetical protein
MEYDSYGFDWEDIELFSSVDKAIEDDDYKFQAEILVELLSKNILDDFDLSMKTSIVSSIVCNLEDDFIYGKDELPIEECNVIYFSDNLMDMYFDDIDKGEIYNYVKEELIRRERYELLNELRKYE